MFSRDSNTSPTNFSASFFMCVHVEFFSLLHFPVTCPCYMSPMCEQHVILSLQHVPATCPCVITPRVRKSSSYFNFWELSNLGFKCGQFTIRSSSKNTETVLFGIKGLSQPIKSKQTGYVIHISQSARSMISSVTFEQWWNLLEKICHIFPFSWSFNENERFPACQKNSLLT